MCKEGYYLNNVRVENVREEIYRSIAHENKPDVEDSKKIYKNVAKCVQCSEHCMENKCYSNLGCVRCKAGYLAVEETRGSAVFTCEAKISSKSIQKMVAGSIDLDTSDLDSLVYTLSMLIVVFGILGYLTISIKLRIQQTTYSTVSIIEFDEETCTLAQDKIKATYDKKQNLGVQPLEYEIHYSEEINESQFNNLMDCSVSHISHVSSNSIPSMESI